MHHHLDRWYAILADRLTARDRHALIAEKRAQELALRAHDDALRDMARDQEDAEVAWLESISKAEQYEIDWQRMAHRWAA